ncbi:MAG: hypothetical protein Kow0047_07780 [Anaerolineae bacterium]
MDSKLQRFCNALIEAGWLAALVVAPLFFNIYSARVFEPDKISLLRAVVFIMIAAWLVKEADRWARGQRRPWRERARAAIHTPLVLPTILLAAAYLVSTALSVTPRISFWGSYQRGQGTLTTLCYIALFAMILGHLRTRRQLQRVAFTIILTSVPISLYGIWQHLAQDPLPWGGNVVVRVSANMGNPIFVAAYLIMAFFVTLHQFSLALTRTWDEEQGTATDAILGGALLFILAIQVLTGIFYSQSRGPFLGWLAGLYIFALLTLIVLARWQPARRTLSPLVQRALAWLWATPIILALLVGGFLILFNLPNSPLAGLRQEVGLGRLGTILDMESGTNRVRTLIWQGVIEMLGPHPPLTYPDGHTDALNALRPLVGYGPESMWVAFNPFYPPELAQHEARMASPDRSHNETYDALVMTGIFGFLAYFALFTSIFYYSLRWLGLIRSAQDRTTFLAVGIAGAILGAIAPRVLEGSWRLMGVGLPFGFISGIVLYVTLAAYRWRRAADALTGVEGGPDRWRQMWIIAILATIVAHFVEIHFGIAIVSTRTYFWTLAAILVLIGTGHLSEAESPSPESSPASPPRARRRRRSQPSSAPRPGEPWLRHGPEIAIATLIFITLAYTFVTTLGRPSSAWALLSEALTTRYDADIARRVDGLGIIWLIAFTWLVGGLLLVGQHRRWEPRPILADLAIYSLATWGAFLVFALWHASRLLWTPPDAQTAFRHVMRHIVLYDAFLVASMAVLALALSWRELQIGPRWANGWPAPLMGLVAMPIAGALIYQICIVPIQADILYKQGQATDAEGLWGNSVVIYQEVVRKMPKEDYYYLFLGRAQLEWARQAQDAGRREEILRQAMETLLKAQQLNPLNTDHTANLARFYRNWGELTSDPAAREERWMQSLAYYEAATRLSPNTAHLYNEWGQVHLMLAELYRQTGRQEEAERHYEEAARRYDRSLELDDRFSQTYVLYGDLYRTQGRFEEAAAAYEQALHLEPAQPEVWGALGFAYAQLGRLDDAIRAAQEVTRYQPQGARGYRNLAVLYAQAGRQEEALAAARQALNFASDAERPEIERLIQDLEGRSTSTP